jgi:dihydroorotate dehydrogenase (NAD+) catalytic subunit
VKLPILGMGWISTVDDALEFLIAGASAVQVGTANFYDPLIWYKLVAGLDAYLGRHGIARVADLVGSLTVSPEHAWSGS